MISLQAAGMLRWGFLSLLMLSLLDSGDGKVSKEAVAHVQCDVCEMAMEEATSIAKTDSITDEDSLSDLVENLCSVRKKEGRWVSRLDIVREDSDTQLLIARQDTAGWCKNECLTIQRACQASLKGNEEKLVSMLQGAKSLKDIKKKLCKKTCAKEPPKLTKWKDEVFSPRDEKELETEDMMEKMKAETGMGMKMYKREDLLSMSEGDMETMSARSDFSNERAAAKMAAQEL